MIWRTGAMSRRAFTAGAGAIGLAALIPGGTAQAVPAATWRRRALTSYQALQNYLYLPDSGLYQESFPTRDGENPYSYVWPLREATAATLDVNHLTHGRFARDVASRFDALERYVDASDDSYASYPPPPLGSGGDPFFDDNGVIGLEHIRRLRLSGHRPALQRAAAAFAFMTKAWDPEGGMHWVDASWNPYRGATNVTSIAAELATHLYEQTGQEHYLEWAVRCYEWVYATMRRDDGLYANGIRFDGVVEETLWTYNSGFMIGAATLLYRATGDRDWLDKADQDAGASLDYWTGDDRLYGQPAIFNAIYLANWLLYSSVRPARRPDLLDRFASYAERVWNQNRDEDTGLFGFQSGGGGAPDPNLRPHTLHQSAAIQLFALLAWPSDYSSVV